MILREAFVQFEVKDSWFDFIQYVLGIDQSTGPELAHDDDDSQDAPSFSKVMARVTSSEASTAESDEENGDPAVANQNILLRLIPDWVLKSN